MTPSLLAHFLDTLVGIFYKYLGVFMFFKCPREIEQFWKLWIAFYSCILTITERPQKPRSLLTVLVPVIGESDLDVYTAKHNLYVLNVEGSPKHHKEKRPQGKYYLNCMPQPAGAEPSSVAGVVLYHTSTRGHQAYDVSCPGLTVVCA